MEAKIYESSLVRYDTVVSLSLFSLLSLLHFSIWILVFYVVQNNNILDLRILDFITVRLILFFIFYFVVVVFYDFDIDAMYMYLRFGW